MKISNADIRYCLDKAAEMFEQYATYILAHQTIPRSVDDLHWIIATYLKCKIEIFKLEAPSPNKSVLGTYIKYPDNFVIICQPDQNHCWNRFVLCKELFHVVLDQPCYRIADIERHLEDVAAVFPVLESEPGPTTVSELLAEIAAMEFLFPYAHRLNHQQQPCDYLAIARQYRIPQVMVEKYLSKSYMLNLGAFAPKP